MKKIAAFAIGATLTSGLWAGALEFAVEMNNTNCLYRCGEEAVFTVTARQDGELARAGSASVKLDNFGAQSLATRTVDLADENPFVVRGNRATPGFLRLTIDAKGAKAKKVWGVGYEPERIRPGSACPDDFDAFWQGAIRDLDAKVPADVKMDRLAHMSNAQRDVYYVSFATYGGRRVYGMLSEPKDLTKGPYPVTVTVPGAGPAEGWVSGNTQTIFLSMNVHYYPCVPGCGRRGAGSEPVLALHKAQEREWEKMYGTKYYQVSGIWKSREDYFYYAAILGVNRAVNWLATRPECDLKRFCYSGTSQGGGFGLILSALNPHITRAAVFVPAMTDLMSSKVEARQSGWPQLIEAQTAEHKAAAERWAPYFDGAHFAARVRIPIRFVVGFADVTCAPHAVYAGYNAVPSADKAIYHGFGMGHGVDRFYYSLVNDWLRK